MLPFLPLFAPSRVAPALGESQAPLYPFPLIGPQGTHEEDKEWESAEDQGLRSDGRGHAGQDVREEMARGASTRRRRGGDTRRRDQKREGEGQNGRGCQARGNLPPPGNRGRLP